MTGRWLQIQLNQFAPGSKVTVTLKKSRRIDGETRPKGHTLEIDADTAANWARKGIIDAKTEDAAKTGKSK